MNNQQEWSIIENKLDLSKMPYRETIFSLGNGYIGMRGTFEEGYDEKPWTFCEGTYLNGFYDSEKIEYEESAYAFPKYSQTMLNVTNTKIIKFYVDDEEFDMRKGTIKEYNRTLNFKEGVLQRSLLWTSPTGKTVQICIQRLISFENKHLACIQYEVVPLNFDGKITFLSVMDGHVSNVSKDQDPRVGSSLKGCVLKVKEQIVEEDFCALIQQTKKTNFYLACGMMHTFSTNPSQQKVDTPSRSRIENKYVFDVKRNQKVQINKYIVYVTSKDYPKVEILFMTKEILKKYQNLGFSYIEKSQQKFLEQYWKRADIQIDGDKKMQQGIRFNLYHLIQSVGRDGKTNISAKGLTGEGYEGHYFWDTEIYILPYFLMVAPHISRKLLEYRYSILDAARQRAREMSHKKGALYPWRTIGGSECSTYFPAGTAQYHINADIAFAIQRYMLVTKDMDFLIQYGAEMLFETARIWADLGDYIENKDGKFCINNVTGPDEYTAIVNNNVYTNLMAKENLDYAYEVARWMKQDAPDIFEIITNKIQLEEEEIKEWKKAVDYMYIPYDDERKLYPQDDSFLNKAPWDLQNTPKENHPLLLHYHPLVIYRYQVCKQPDLLLAMFLLNDEFTLEEKRINYEYYEKITTHDSSLSSCIFNVMACEIGYYHKAEKYFINTALTDLEDYHGNTKDGIHIANMAGAWMCIVNGFAGLRITKEGLQFNPYLPESWNSYQLQVSYQNRWIQVRVEREKVQYRLLEGNSISIIHRGEKQMLKPGDVLEKRGNK